MYRYAPYALLIVFFIAACAKQDEPVAEAPTLAEVPSICNSDSPCAGSICASSITTALAQVPADACPREGEFQVDVDVFSWNSFIALNWPANTSTCGPDTGKSILSGDGPTVWQTYTDDVDIFVGPGELPAAWCSKSFESPHDFQHIGKASPHLLEMILPETIVPEGLTAEAFNSILEAVGGPLTDQHGRFVRYQKLVNQTEYTYLINDTLWNQEGQVGKSISFLTGSMEIKAAWKVLNDEEKSGGLFYMTEGIVYNDAQGDPSPGTNPVTLGLVGLHIIHKTPTQSTWFWSTFEHVNNTTRWFNNPNCTDCTDNKQTAEKPYTELDPQGNPINAPVQVTRVTPITAEIDTLNAYYQGLLSGSVWANYQLISTQWATGGAPGPPIGKGTPAVLANTTLETFIQDRSNCLVCHYQAKTTADSSADFSFLLGEAQSTSGASQAMWQMPIRTEHILLSAHESGTPRSSQGGQ